jgi:hypothetical protein
VGLGGGRSPPPPPPPPPHAPPHAHATSMHPNAANLACACDHMYPQRFVYSHGRCQALAPPATASTAPAGARSRRHPPGTHGCACRGLQQQRNGKPLLAPTLYIKVLNRRRVISAATPLLNVWSWCEFCCGSRWEGAAVLLSQLSAVVSAPPLVPKTIPVSPVNPWSI